MIGQILVGVLLVTILVLGIGGVLRANKIYLEETTEETDTEYKCGGINEN